MVAEALPGPPGPQYKTAPGHGTGSPPPQQGLVQYKAFPGSKQQKKPVQEQQPEPRPRTQPAQQQQQRAGAAGAGTGARSERPLWVIQDEEDRAAMKAGFPDCAIWSLCHLT